jgi:hypothetical protein
MGTASARWEAMTGGESDDPMKPAPSSAREDWHTVFEDPDNRFFPEPDEIIAHAIASARMMFAHAAFEAEVRALQDAITDNPSFGELRDNQWKAGERPHRMTKLINVHLGEGVPEAEAIAEALTDAIDPSKQRNHLCHGEWWVFNVRTSAITVRGGIRWESDESPPAMHDYTASQIEVLSGRFTQIKEELVRLRRCIEDRVAARTRRIRTPFSSEWDTTQLPAERRAHLDSGLSFEQMVSRVLTEMKIIRVSVKPYEMPAPGEPKDARDARQIIFLLGVADETCDLLFNAPDGLRGRYWQSPDHGVDATKYLIRQLAKTRLVCGASSTKTREGRPNDAWRDQGVLGSVLS